MPRSRAVVISVPPDAVNMLGERENVRPFVPCTKTRRIIPFSVITRVTVPTWTPFRNSGIPTLTPDKVEVDAPERTLCTFA